MWDYSPEKIQLYGELASERITKQLISEDIRSLKLMHTAIGAMMSKEGQKHFSAALKELEGHLKKSEKKTQSQQRSELVSRLKTLGAKVTLNGI